MKLHPGHETRPDDYKFMDSAKTPLTEAEAAYYLRAAWKNIYDVYPSVNSLALLWAQSAGETGRWKLLRCNNWGNIKKRTDTKWTSYDAGEVINGKHQMFYPYHPQTHFAAFDGPLAGAEYYIRFLSQRTRYKKAWVEVMAGDPVAYCRELKKAGYFTAGLAHYTRGVVSLTNEFKRKADALMTWAPEPEPEPEPVVIPEPKPEPELEPVVEPIAEPVVEPEPAKGLLTMIMEFLSKLFGEK
ncbi:hypothetical protein LCGC14_0427340 [marine sediment metagenome]|uniref:Mannosyl-glycoprotein endo-beta-N-acetylglucosamidase-like domain-containing protein n=1 Tax=marine sediment metagenome TaxID=412755 RepID=A0A0F9T7D0_9ZZZZ